MLRDFLLGFVRIHVLHHAAEEPVYGLALIEELARHGYTLSPGTLYPLLRGLADDGYLRQQRRLVDGKVRKYYAITARGRRALLTARTQIVELVEEVLEPALRGGRNKARSRRRPRARRRPEARRRRRDATGAGRR